MRIEHEVTLDSGDYSGEVADWFGAGLEGADVNWALYMTAAECWMERPKLTLRWEPCLEGERS